MPERDTHAPIRAVTSGPQHHFFGYYDKTPWDATGRYMLGMEVGFMDRAPTGDDEAVVGLIDTESGDAWRPLDTTTAWHWQLGCGLQWLPDAPGRLIVYNVRRDGGFGSVVSDPFGGGGRLLPLPVYALSPAGRAALSVNFARLAEMRPGYGYEGAEDPWRDDPRPDADGIHVMDLETSRHRLILSLDQAARFRPLPTMEGAKHWFNHVQINADGSRFAVLHRWIGPGTGKKWHTRMLTAALDGAGLFCVSDHEKVSHYDWRDEGHVLAWAHRRELGERYWLFTDRSDERRVIGEGVLTRDGHCSWSPDRRWILTDTYPDAESKRALLLYRPADGRLVQLGRFHSPPELTGPIRCDLHPRWSRDGRQVCIDSAHQGTRQIYTLDLSAVLAR